MTLYEIFKTIHVLSMGVWFGSSLAITVIGIRALRGNDAWFGPYSIGAGWWAGRAHTAAGVLLLITGFAMIGDAGIDITEPWILIAIVGLIVAMGIGGAVIGPSATKLAEGVAAAGGTMTAEARPHADRLLLFSRIELVVLALVVADMVIKPG